ncbi:MAG: low specificity L-threonine aldolase [Variibacter sp.]
MTNHINLGSDTVTKPTEAMYDAMRRAELGDDGREGDPTVRQLEERAAEITGKEAGLFVPSGTMANLVALLAHAQRGGEVLLDAEAHFLRSEMGGIAAVAGLFHRPVPGKRGAIDIDAVRAMIRPKIARNKMPTALVTVETSHNSAGGAVMGVDYLTALGAVAQEHGVPFHIDGARLFNAAVKLGVSAAAVAKPADSVCFCISKGLSAPFGSLLCGSAEFIERSRAFRRMVGGGMRQAGVMAAAGLVAFDQMIDRLAEDHARAAQLAAGIARIDADIVDPSPQTNIVMVDVSRTGADAQRWLAALRAEGVIAGEWTPTQLRFVTHRHIDDAAVEQALAVFRKVYEGFKPNLAAAQ